MTVLATEPVADAASQRRFPPVAQVVTAALGLVVVGGIYMASYAPRRPPLGLPIAIVSVSGALVLVGIVMMVRTRELAWDRFFLVFKWALLAYVISAGLIGYAFVRDHVRGGPLLVLVLMLVLFAVSVPLIIGFTVARYQAGRSSAG